jgi:hypothetical protein
VPLPLRNVPLGHLQMLLQDSFIHSGSGSKTRRQKGTLRTAL